MSDGLRMQRMVCAESVLLPDAGRFDWAEKGWTGVAREMFAMRNRTRSDSRTGETVNLDPQDYLDLVEKAGGLVFIDIEAIGLKGDYNSVICVSLKPYGKKPYTLAIKQAGNDERVVREAKKEMEKYGCWATYYGKGFDIPMLNTRLLKWGQPPIEKRFHLDLYFSLKANLLTARRSQGHLLSWLGTPEQKMGVSASAWSELPFKISEHLPVMIKRCESDVSGLEALYRKTRHLIRDLKR